MKRGLGRNSLNITSSSGEGPSDILGLSNGAAQAGLDRARGGAVARVTVRQGVTSTAWLPGPFDTERAAEAPTKGPARPQRGGKKLTRGVQGAGAQNSIGRPLRHASDE